VAVTGASAENTDVASGADKRVRSWRCPWRVIHAVVAAATSNEMVRKRRQHRQTRQPHHPPAEVAKATGRGEGVLVVREDVSTRWWRNVGCPAYRKCAVWPLSLVV
jgi:hypothetical protein